MPSVEPDVNQMVLRVMRIAELLTTPNMEPDIGHDMKLREKTQESNPDVQCDRSDREARY